MTIHNFSNFSINIGSVKDNYRYQSAFYTCDMIVLENLHSILPHLSSNDNWKVLISESSTTEIFQSLLLQWPNLFSITMHPKGSRSENENFLTSILMDETNKLGQKWTWLLLTQNGHIGSILITLANSDFLNILLPKT